MMTVEDKRKYKYPGRQLLLVMGVMDDDQWHTLEDIAFRLGASPSHPITSISARLRDLRKERYGGQLVLRRYRGHGINEYKMFYAEQ